MTICDLEDNEIQQVSGGVIPTQFVSLNTSFERLVSTAPTDIKTSIGKLAVCCCCCHCCGTHSNLTGIGAIKGL